MLHQDSNTMRVLLLACGWQGAQIRALAEVRRKNEEADLEQTPESRRLEFARWLWQSGRLSEWWSLDLWGRRAA
jgi:hypothetical protein